MAPYIITDDSLLLLVYQNCHLRQLTSAYKMIDRDTLFHTKSLQKALESRHSLCICFVRNFTTSSSLPCSCQPGRSGRSCSPVYEPALPVPLMASLSSSSSSSGRELSILSILLTDVVRFLWDSVSNSLSKRT